MNDVIITDAKKNPLDIQIQSINSGENNFGFYKQRIITVAFKGDCFLQKKQEIYINDVHLEVIEIINNDLEEGEEKYFTAIQV